VRPLKESLQESLNSDSAFTLTVQRVKNSPIRAGERRLRRGPLKAAQTRTIGGIEGGQFMAFKFKNALAVACASTIISSAATAQEFRIDDLFVIGDSLSDAGTYSQAIPAAAALNGQAVPDIPYQFLNNAPDGSSQTYAGVVAEGLGIEHGPNLITGVPAAAGTPIDALSNDVPVGGNNFAQGGARVTLENTDPALLGGGITQTSTNEQINRLLAANPSFDSNDLVIYWVGANDITVNAEMVGDGSQSVAQAGQAVGLAATQAVAQVERLIEAGATNLVVVTVPDVGTSTPVGAGQGPQGQGLLSGLSDTYNSILVNGVAGRATVVDAGAVLGDVLADPVRYGFSDIDHLDINQTACLTPSAVQCIDGVTTRPGITPIFADDRHPTARAHRVLGELALSALTAIGQSGVIPVATISALRQQSQGLEQRLNLGAFFINDDEGNRIRRPVGNVEVYGGVELGFYESDEQQVVPGFDATTQVVKAAADVMVTENILLGIGGSIDHGQVDFNDGRGGFDSRLFVGGVFGVAQIIPGVYANGFLGGGIIDSVDIERNFTTSDLAGNVVSRNSYDAETDGTYFIARANVGAVLPVGKGFFVNPSVGFAYERVDIDGFQESGRGGAPESLAARVGDQEYEGQRGTLALGGFYRPPSDPTWTFGLRGSWEHDFNDDDIAVPFAVGTAPTNVQFAPRPDDSYGLISATIVKELTHSTSMNLQASTNIEQSGVDGYTVGLVFKHTF